MGICTEHILTRVILNAERAHQWFMDPRVRIPLEQTLFEPVPSKIYDTSMESKVSDKSMLHYPIEACLYAPVNAAARALGNPAAYVREDGKFCILVASSSADAICLTCSQ